MSITPTITTVLIILSTLWVGNQQQPDKIESKTVIKTNSYKIGDIVKSSNFEEESYWEGKVVRVIKEVLYQVELTKVYVNSSYKLFLNESDCTGKKRLSYKDGSEFNKTKIWVHERCLD